MFDELGGLKVYFGANGPCKDKNNQPFTAEAWEIKHITDYREDVSGQDTTIGLPNNSFENVNSYDVLGSFFTASISFKRLDAEEEISNFDFLFNELNQLADGNYAIGINWLTSQLQITHKGYLLKLYDLDHCERYCTNDSNNCDRYYVAVTNVSFNFPVDKPGELDVTLTVLQKRPFGELSYEAKNALP